MKVVCAGCRTHLSGDELDDRVSHGICPDCAARELSNLFGRSADAPCPQAPAEAAARDSDADP